MNQVLRAFSAVVDDVDASERSVVAKISAGDVDRHRTIISSSGVRFENYRKNPVVLFEHGRSLSRGSLPIGRNVWIKSDGKGTGRILAKTRFAEDDFSDLLFSFYQDGTMRGWSISILPEETSPPSREELRSRPELKDCEIIFRASDLLEYSAVSVPSCASALSDPELRSLSTLVVRGFWTPSEEIEPLIAPVVERMNESTGLADGGALVADDDDDDVKTKKKKKKKSEDDDESDDDAETSAADDVKRAVDDADDDDDEPVTRDGPVDEPRDSIGRWTDGAGSDKNEVRRRKKKKLDLGYGEPDDSGTLHKKDSAASRKRDAATKRLQESYDKHPIYKTDAVLRDPKTGATYSFSVTKNAYHLSESEEKKYRAVMHVAKDGATEDEDSESFNNVDKAVKWVHATYKLNLKEGLKPTTSDRSAIPDLAVDAVETESEAAAFVETVERIAPDVEVETAAVVEPPPVVAPEPEPARDPFAGLPPFIGRSFADVYIRRSRRIDAWVQANRKMIRDFNDWRCGKG